MLVGKGVAVGAGPQNENAATAIAAKVIRYMDTGLRDSIQQEPFFGILRVYCLIGRIPVPPTGRPSWRRPHPGAVRSSRSWIYRFLDAHHLYRLCGVDVAADVEVEVVGLDLVQVGDVGEAIHLFEGFIGLYDFLDVFPVEEVLGLALSESSLAGPRL